MRSLIRYIFRLVVKYWMSPKFNTSASIQQQREALEGFAKLSILPKGTTIQPLDIEKLKAEWISVGNVPEDRVILYLHGGAYNIGSLKTHRELAARISKECGLKTLLIDYRLAPEEPYPAALEDAVMTYRWFLKNGYLPKNIVLAGDSAGGGLAIASLIALRDSGEALPAAAVCLSPWTDLALTGESLKTHIHKDPFLNVKWLQLMAGNYVASGNRYMPYISPVYANLSMLPPLFIQVGSDEILLSDSIRLANRAREAGVDVTLQVCQKMWHVWHFFAGKMPEANDALTQISCFINKHLIKKEAQINLEEIQCQAN